MSRTPQQALFLTVIPGLLLGCGSVDTGPDYDQTSVLVSERTGQAIPRPSPKPTSPSLRSSLKQTLAGGLSLQEALHTALARNAQLRAHMLRIGIAKADLAQAGLLPNPSLSLSGNWAQGGNFQLGASLVQGLVKIFLIPLRKKIANSRLQAVKLRIADRAIRLCAEVTGAYYRALSLQRALALGRANLQIADRSANIVQHRHTAGLANQAKLNLTRAARLAARQLLLKIKLQSKLSVLQLRQLIGLARSSEPLTLSGKLPSLASLPSDQELLARALADRLDLRAKSQEITAAEHALSKTKASLFPLLQVGPSLQRNDTGEKFTGISANLTLPLWDQNRVKIARAEFAVQRLKAEREYLKDQIASEVLSSSTSLRDRARMLKLYRDELLPLQLESVESITRAYRGGQASILLLIQSQQALLQQRNSYLKTLQLYAQDLAGLQKTLSGQLTPGTPPQ